MVGLTTKQLNCLNRKDKHYLSVDLYKQYFPLRSKWPKDVQNKFERFLVDYFIKLKSKCLLPQDNCKYSNQEWHLDDTPMDIDTMVDFTVQAVSETFISPAATPPTTPSKFNRSPSGTFLSSTPVKTNSLLKNASFVFTPPATPSKTEQQLQKTIQKQTKRIIELENKLSISHQINKEQQTLINSLQEELRPPNARPKRTHVADGSTPHPVRKLVMTSLMQNTPGNESKKHFSSRAKVYVMRLLSHQMSYSQINKAIFDLQYLMPNESDLKVEKSPSPTTIGRYFKDFAILVKLHCSEIFNNSNLLAHSTDETPDQDQCPVIVTCIQNLSSGTKMVLGLNRMGGKTAEDMRRVEEQTLRILHMLSDSSEDFDFKKSFLQRVAIRGGDNAATERKYHKMLETEVSASIPRVSCQLHLVNNVVKHGEINLSGTSMIFPMGKLVAKYLGDRSSKTERLEFKHFLTGVKGEKMLRIRSLTGVRFIELVSDTAHLYKLFPFILEFSQSLESENPFKKEIDVLQAAQCMKHFYVDLKTMVLINACFLETTYRAAVDQHSNLSSYKRLTMKILELCQLETEELFDLLLLINNIPFIADYFKPTAIQREIIEDIDTNFDDQDRTRSYEILEIWKKEILYTFTMVNATLLETEWSAEIDKPGLTDNNACEGTVL